MFPTILAGHAQVNDGSNLSGIQVVVNGSTKGFELVAEGQLQTGACAPQARACAARQCWHTQLIEASNSQQQQQQQHFDHLQLESCSGFVLASVHCVPAALTGGG
jgi:hypothetical protein